MIPRNIILPKVNSIPAAFREPENLTVNSLSDKAQGGIALNDPSKGRTYQLWVAEYESGEIRIKPENAGSYVFSLPAPGAITISLAFDNNMGVVLAWQTANSSHLYHYQTLTSSYGTKVVTGTTSCKVAIDEPANFYLPKSDVIFAYTKNDSLFFTVQRERYENEHLAGVTLGKIIRMGMNEHNRFQFECGS